MFRLIGFKKQILLKRMNKRFSFFCCNLSFVQRHTNLEYIIEHIRREDVPEIPEIALREAIINAFCHRYYFEEGLNITIEVFDDRVIISSFGGLPPGLQANKFGKESVSVQRNPIIADLLL